LLLIGGAIGSLGFYDLGTFLPGRSSLKHTYILTRVGLRNGLGDYFKDPLYKPIISEFARWDISSESMLATKFSWEESTYEYVHSSNIISQNDWIMDSYSLVIINTNNNKVREIAKLGTTVETGGVHDCRFAPSTNKAVCLQRKDIIIFDAETNKEVLRYTFKGGHIGSNFDKMEWMSENEIALYRHQLKTSDYNKNILKLNINTGEVTEICHTDFISKTFSSAVLDKKYSADEVACSDLPEFEALFGSKEWPVRHLLSSAGPAEDRFYFYKNYREAPWPYGKSWIEGYDRETGNKFYVATVDSIFKSIFGDSFIVDWFGWSWF